MRISFFHSIMLCCIVESLNTKNYKIMLICHEMGEMEFGLFLFRI